MADGTSPAPDSGAAPASPSLRETLAATMKAAEEGTLEVPQLNSIKDPIGTPAPAAEPKPAAEKPADGQPASGDRPRGPDGKFIAKDGAAAEPGAAAAAAPKPTETPATDPAKPPEAQPAAVEAPQHWAQADKDMFAKQTPEAKKWLLDRHAAMEGDYTRKTQAIAPLIKEAENASGYLRSIGVNHAEAFRVLLSNDYMLRKGTPEQKVETVKRLLDYYKITLPNTASPQPSATPPANGATPPAGQSDDWEDPAVTALRKQVGEANAQTQEVLRILTSQQEDRNMTEILAFENAKDASGSAAHPHFNAVLPKILELAADAKALGRQPVLKDLYDEACRLNPEISAKAETDRIAAERAKWEGEQKAKEEEARKKAAQAAGAASSISGGPRGGTTSASSAKPGSLRATLEEAAAQVTGGRL